MVNITKINPNRIINVNFNEEDLNIIPGFEITGLFLPGKDIIEHHIYDLNKTLLYSNYNFKNWSINQDPSITSEEKNSTIELDPQEDLFTLGFNEGIYYSLYNFISREFNSSPNNLFFISEISSDRTELRLKSNSISDQDINEGFTSVKEKIDNPQFFDEIYLNLLNNEYLIVVNVELNNGDVLVKLYEPLPPQYGLKTVLFVVSKVSESEAFEVEMEEEFEFLDDVINIGKPNLNLNLKDQINNSSTYFNTNQLLSTSSSASLNQLLSILDEQSTELNIDYNDYSNFVHFSSAKNRLDNFLIKLGGIQQFETDLQTLNSITGPTSSSLETQNNKISLENKIQTLIKNFDGYEYFLYYESSSFSYPKLGSFPPYSLPSITDPIVISWYQNQANIASRFDEDNFNSLFYSIPEFIRDNPNNENYIIFVNMIAQLFDYIWTYIKYSPNKLNATNNLTKGAPLELVEDIINSFGLKTYGNNFNSQNNFIAFTGLDNNQLFPPTGSELITNNISANITSSLIPNWNPFGSLSNITSQNYAYPVDDISKEIYKRLYHNLPRLLKQKGTRAGLRMISTIFGIPDTILKIREFGGKDKIDSNNWDNFYRRYSYAYKTFNSSSALIPWQPLTQNFELENQYIVPDTIQFRFKTEGIPLINDYTQSLLLKKSTGTGSNDYDFGVFLHYSSSFTQGTYSGSNEDNFKSYGYLNFFLSGSSGTLQSPSLYLPFFNGDWWSVMIQRDQHVGVNNNSTPTVYSIHAKNKIYEGYDGDNLGFFFSSSINPVTISTGSIYGVATYGSSVYGAGLLVSGSYNEAWNNFGTSSVDGLYLGGVTSSIQIGNLSFPNNIISGSFQEFRYYRIPISKEIFDNYVMNPRSIEGEELQGPLSSYNLLSFRAPLGNELESILITPFSINSFHPSILTTSSFIEPTFQLTSSLYEIISYNTNLTGGFSEPNVEIIYQNTPNIGLRGENNDKIQIPESKNFGNVLSLNTSIQQDKINNEFYSLNTNNLEIGFSPQDEINNDIIQQLGFFNIGEFIGNPENRFNGKTTYKELDRLREEYFLKYGKNYNVWDFIRLIKYFDNSLFKIFKDFTPVKSKLSTGIIIKPTILERQRIKPIDITIQEDILTGSIEVGNFFGSNGGSMPDLGGNISSSGPGFNIVPITQSFTLNIPTLSGSTSIIQSSQDEFYNGEFLGAEIQITTSSLNPQCKPILRGTTDELFYKVTLYSNETTQPFLIGTTTLPIFLSRIKPNPGEVYLWYDSGNPGFSTANPIGPSGTLTPVPPNILSN